MGTSRKINTPLILYQEECLSKTKIKIKDILRQSNPDRIHYQ